MNGKLVIKQLKAEGWKKMRQKGAHVQMGKGVKRTTVPLHGKEDLKRGTLNKIKRDTGVMFEN